MNIIAMLAIYCCVSLAALVALACIALALRPPRMEDDQTTPEATVLPPPVLHAMSMRDRLEASQDLTEARARWVTQMETDRLIMHVERGIAL